MKKHLTIIASILALPALACAGEYTNLICRYPGEASTYVLTTVGFDVHFCAPGEDGVLSGLGVHETNLRTIELKKLSALPDGSYAAEFLFGLDSQACPRCNGNAAPERAKTLKCSVSPAREQLCHASVHGPAPELGPQYDKALRYGIGDDYWEPVPWVTLYSGKDFIIYTFTGPGSGAVYTYDANGYYKEYMSAEEFRADIKSRLQKGYKQHPYSTNKAGLAAAKKLLGYALN